MVKAILGVVAAGSFAIAFGQEKLAAYLPFVNTVNNSACLKQFYREEPPFLAKDSLNKDSHPLCFNGFSSMYSGVSKTPLWVAEHLTPERLSQKIKREDSFHEELSLPQQHRALLSDYRGSGYDRGHMAPNADMPDKASQYDSFSLANMVPQAPKNNQQVWRELEEATRAMVTKQKHEVYVITGPVYSAKKVKRIGSGVIVPNAVYKAIYIPKTGAIGAYYAPNDNSLKVQVVSVCKLEEELNINLFPQLTPEQKRNTYRLPLTANQVKANKALEYSHWDAESQCAEDVSADQLQALKKQFSSQPMPAQAGSTTTSKPAIDPVSQENIVKELTEALIQYLLQFIK